MRKELVLILMMLFVLGSFSTGYASEEDVATENTITLEQAKALAKKNSRSLKKYGINIDRKKAPAKADRGVT